MDIRAHLEPENTRSGIQMLHLYIHVGSDVRQEVREQNRDTVNFQEVWDKFGEFIRRNICGDTHFAVDVKRWVRRNTDVQFTEGI